MTRVTIESRLAEMGVVLPAAAAPAANYLPYAQAGNLLFTAGQLPLKDGKLTASGLLGRDLDTAAGRDAARQCAINILAQVKAATGDLGRLKRIVKISVFVASTPDFTEQHLVTNGASELIGQVFGDNGAHARSAFGVAQIPMGACVEIEMIAEIA